jgi:methionyl-tRNA formyltransferase
MRTVFIGTSQFAASLLEHLAGTEHRPALVLTRPDRPSGRGRSLTAPPVAVAAGQLQLAVAQPQNVNDSDSQRQIDTVRPEVVVVCAFGALITEPLLSEYELWNVHPSLLPRWRGAAPIERAIIAGDQLTGVSIMRLTAGLDSGPVCLSGEERISVEDDYGALAGRLQELGGRLLVEALNERPPFVAQDEAHLSYAEKITAADRLLDPAKDAAELERTVRALHPHIGARVSLADQRLLGVHSARLIAQQGGGVRAQRGVRVSDGRLVLVCADGMLELCTVQPAGGKPMSATAYLRGHAP